MAYLRYSYQMTIEYESEVSKCYFTIKCLPTDDLRQEHLNHEIFLEPTTSYALGKDSFGNKQIYGCEKEPHGSFTFTIKGLVETSPGIEAGRVVESRLGMYKYPHGKCIPGDALTSFIKKIKGDEEYKKISKTREKCLYAMDKVFYSLKYVSGSTQVETTAEEAFSHGEGVCQDYAHILITVLKGLGIPARYVCGFVVGEGESHAWVEAACEGDWIAMDPTYNLPITDQYIKIGVGRDATDCTINRGVMWGGGEQTQRVTVMVNNFSDI